jgi:hypothetical protein
LDRNGSPVLWVLVASAAVTSGVVNLFELNLPKPRRWLLSIKPLIAGWVGHLSFDEVTSTLDVAREQAAQHRLPHGLPRHKRRHGAGAGVTSPLGNLRNTVAPCNDPEWRRCAALWHSQAADALRTVMGGMVRTGAEMAQRRC